MENMITTLRGKIEEIIETSDSQLFKDVALDILDDSETDEDLELHMKDILNCGCISGVVPSLIYYEDTRKFFMKHFEEILELLNDMKEDFGTLDFLNKVKINYNNLSWLAYEEFTRKLMNELEIEY